MRNECLQRTKGESATLALVSRKLDRVYSDIEKARFLETIRKFRQECCWAMKEMPATSEEYRVSGRLLDAMDDVSKS
jgi:hypothetical protein